MKFTAKSIDGLQLPAGKTDHLEWDSELSGWGIRLREGGSRTWVFQYMLGKKQRRMSLGAATPESFKTLKDKDGAVIHLGIRERVGQLQARVKLGEDPAGQKAESRQRAAETFEAVARLYLATRKPDMRPGPYDQIDRHLLKYCKPLHPLQLANISQRTLATRINEIRGIAGAVQANRTRSTLLAFYCWAMRQGIVTTNPVANTGRFDEKPRDRVLTDDELREVWDAAGDDQYGSIIKLLMLTASRANEIASLRRSEIGRIEVPKAKRDGAELPAFTIDAIDLPPERMKAGRRHIVPLSLPARAILARQPVLVDERGNVRDLIFGTRQGGFSGWSKSKERLDERIHAARVAAWEQAGSQGARPGPMKPWVVHDLRRSVDTGMNDGLGIAPHVVAAVLAHTSSHASGKVGSERSYNWAEYMRERVEALQLWADHVMTVVSATSTITPSLQPAA